MAEIYSDRQTGILKDKLARSLTGRQTQWLAARQTDLQIETVIQV
jgi:hypothetical protein